MIKKYNIGTAGLIFASALTNKLMVKNEIYIEPELTMPYNYVPSIMVSKHHNSKTINPTKKKKRRKIAKQSRKKNRK